ncbi:hypothetical protein LCGC14_1254170 [marine sediment metagenome]|uniref:Uncharacterized protein n=1 Tax=marine sediment metagenome TaxID=412755 RepID=A0A0F9L5J9_9ZZZZ
MPYSKLKGLMADGKSFRYVQVDAEGRIVIAPESSITVKKIRVRKQLEANGSAHAAGDVLSESDSDGVGTAWTFHDVVRVPGGAGRIVQVTADTQVESQDYIIGLQVYTKYPTSELDDNAAAASPNPADGPFMVDEITLPALHSRGDNSYAVSTPSTTGNLPLLFICEPGKRELYLIAIAVTATTHTATEWLDITLYIEQF